MNSKARLNENVRRYRQRWKKENLEKIRLQDRRRNLKKKGLTLEGYEALLLFQGSRCANPGCRTDSPSKIGWVVDHDHETGKVRGILCSWCNSALGHAKDAPAILRGLADYLEAFK